jgi:hypothetical protein
MVSYDAPHFKRVKFLQSLKQQINNSLKNSFINNKIEFGLFIAYINTILYFESEIKHNKILPDSLSPINEWK